jgi:hypothetical protein
MRVKEEIEKNWKGAEDAYRRLKNHFHQKGRYEDEGKAYYREKLMAQRAAWQEKKIGKWSWLFMLNILAGFGEKVTRTIIGAVVVIGFFWAFYWLGSIAGIVKLSGMEGSMVPKWLQHLYFSVVTFASFGNITPQSGLALVLVIIEVILGYLFLGVLITIIARKFGR